MKYGVINCATDFKTSFIYKKRLNILVQNKHFIYELRSVTKGIFFLSQQY